ncbi:SRPBCC family protein [Dactylosporangium sp. NPDC051541]|uniref:SRPBCC family protein n=1 Tax=Dactylosporangium sp. NPDC051541 TaxID=3363977 RepID=UPI003793DBE6
MRRDTAVDGPCGADEVWDRYVRPRRWPEWAPQIRSVDYAGEVITPGTGGVVHGVGGVRVRFRILDVDGGGPVRRWVWAVSVLGVRMRFEHLVEAHGRGARTRLVVAGPAPLVLAYLPVARAALTRLTCASTAS